MQYAKKVSLPYFLNKNIIWQCFVQVELVTGMHADYAVSHHQAYLSLFNTFHPYCMQTCDSK